MIEGTKLVDRARIKQAERRCSERSKKDIKTRSMANVIEKDSDYVDGGFKALITVYPYIIHNKFEIVYCIL